MPMPRPSPLRPLLALAALLGTAACDIPHHDPPGTNSHLAPVVAAGKGRVDIEGGIVRLAARRDGVIRTVNVEEGDDVAAGQVLAELDTEMARRQMALAAAEVESALAGARRARIDHAAARREALRLEALVGSESVSRQERDLAADRLAQAAVAEQESSAAVAAARARLGIAEQEIEERRIVAPTAGRIVQRQARPGSGVSTVNVTPLFLFVPDVPRIVRAEVEEIYLPWVHVGQRIEVVLDADDSRRWQGRVLRIGKVIGQRTPSEDPTERQDNRVVEVVVTLAASDALIGQRVVARFMRE